MTKNTEPNYISKCHKSPLKVINGDEGTSYYECTKCERPADIYVDTPKPKTVKMFKNGEWSLWDGSDNIDKLMIEEELTVEQFKERFPDGYQLLRKIHESFN